MNRKQLVIENSGRAGGRKSPDESKFSQSTYRRVGQLTDIEKEKLKYNRLAHQKICLTRELIKIAQEDQLVIRKLLYD